MLFYALIAVVARSESLLSTNTSYLKLRYLVVVELARRAPWRGRESATREREAAGRRAFPGSGSAAGASVASACFFCCRLLLESGFRCSKVGASDAMTKPSPLQSTVDAVTWQWQINWRCDARMNLESWEMMKRGEKTPKSSSSYRATSCLKEVVAHLPSTRQRQRSQ